MKKVNRGLGENPTEFSARLFSVHVFAGNERVSVLAVCYWAVL